MAHFALVDEDNIVVNVVVVPNEQEHRGEEFLSKDLGLGGRWLQTSYNSQGGVHYNRETMTPTGKPAFRKNYAGIGYRYDETLDAFVPPKPIGYPSYVLNPETALWEPPIPEPEPVEGNRWFWAEKEQEWFLVPNIEIQEP